MNSDERDAEPLAPRPYHRRRRRKRRKIRRRTLRLAVSWAIGGCLFIAVFIWMISRPSGGGKTKVPPKLEEVRPAAN